MKSSVIGKEITLKQSGEKISIGDRNKELKQSGVNHVKKCLESSNTAEKLTTHRLAKLVNLKRKDKLLKQPFQSQETEKLHERKKANLPKVDDRTCKYCGKAWSYPYQLLIHLPVHTNEKQFSCMKCGSKFKFRKTCRRHEITCPLNVKAKAPCSLPGQLSASGNERNPRKPAASLPKAALPRRITGHSKNMDTDQQGKKKDIKRFEDETQTVTVRNKNCPGTVDKSIKGKKTSIERHADDTAMVHDGDGFELKKVRNYLGNTVVRKVISCERFHRLTKTKEKRKFPCQICKKRFTRKEHVEGHLKRHYGENFKCKNCGLKFNTLREIDSHYFQVHSTVITTDKAMDESKRKGHEKRREKSSQEEHEDIAHIEKMIGLGAKEVYGQTSEVIDSNSVENTSVQEKNISRHSISETSCGTDEIVKEYNGGFPEMKDKSAVGVSDLEDTDISASEDNESYTEMTLLELYSRNDSISNL